MMCCETGTSSYDADVPDAGCLSIVTTADIFNKLCRRKAFQLRRFHKHTPPYSLSPTLTSILGSQQTVNDIQTQKRLDTDI